MIKLYYGIFKYWFFDRKDWDFKKDGAKANTFEERERLMIHKYIPLKFRTLIMDKAQKWTDYPNHQLKKIEFTLGIDTETGIQPIAIVHPRDNFNKKIGRKIVEGRIKRQRGELKGRYKYHDNEPWIYDPSGEE